MKINSFNDLILNNIGITQNEFDLFCNFFYLKYKNRSDFERTAYAEIGDRIFNNPDLLAKFRKFEYLEKYFDKKNDKPYCDYIRECFNNVR